MGLGNYYSEYESRRAVKIKQVAITENIMSTGTVYLVGAGPGDPGLITCRGRALLEEADVVVYDRLIGVELLAYCRTDAEKIFVGKEAARHALPQDEINALLVQRALEGKSVCRLKGGDPFVFGRGGEEALYCVQHNVPFEVVPGVTSSIGGPAYAGIPVTQREIATSFAVVTGHTKEEEAPPENLPVADTIVFLMGVRALPKIVKSLKARGDDPSTPVALVRWGTTVQQQVVVGTLDNIEAEVARVRLKPPALIVVGNVVNLRESLAWFDKRPLWGQTVVVTRAREQASTLVEGLRARGAQVVQCPTIRVESLTDVEYAATDEAIENLAVVDWCVFTSTNGVEQFWARLKRLGYDARAFGKAKTAAIGPATARALQARGIEPDYIPESSISESVAAGLLELWVEGQTILVARALESREVLEERLREGGASVIVAPVYRTVPDVGEAETVRDLLAAGELSWVTFSSSSTVRNFLEAIGSETVVAARDTFRVACIGPVTAQTATELGLSPDVIAEEATVESLIVAIESETLKKNSSP
jgi:uroporphyrinogen III methyltransferase/synthase